MAKACFAGEVMNRIKVNLQQSITVFAERGWSQLLIARELHMDRAPMGHQLAANAATNPGVGSVAKSSQQPRCRLAALVAESVFAL